MSDNKKTKPTDFEKIPDRQISTESMDIPANDIRIGYCSQQPQILQSRPAPRRDSDNDTAGDKD